MDKRTHKSRIFGQKIVKRNFQLRFSLVIFSLYLVLILLNWIIGVLHINHVTKLGLIGMDSVYHLNALNDILLKASALSIIILYAASLFFSHSIAGPIYRFERVLEQLSKGDLNLKFSLRKWDEFKELGGLFNSSIHNIKEKFLADKRDRDLAIEEIASAAKKIKEKGLDKEAHEIEQLCARLQKTEGRIQF